MGTHIDVHCHYFNFRYVLKEILSIQWSMAHGAYPWSPTDGTAPAAPGVAFPVATFDTLFNYYADLLTVGFDNCGRNYDFELSQYQRSRMKCVSLITAPLMMDIFFILANRAPDAAAAPLSFAPASPGEVDAFKAQGEAVKKAVLHNIHARHQNREPRAGWLAEVLANAENMVKHLTEEIALDMMLMFDGGTDKKEQAQQCWEKEFPGVEFSWGYADHLNEIRDLKHRRPNAVFPFLAVDPRRRNFMTLVEKLVGPGKDFTGVKLYPGLGYFPDDEKLQPLYAYCVEHTVPITAHTNPGGLPSMGYPMPATPADPNDPYPAAKYFGNPANWQPVLKTYPGLWLNLAHFGGMDQAKTLATTPENDVPATNWTRIILDYLRDDAKHIYSDISYYTLASSPTDIQTILDRHPEIREKLMFGTDYVMIMLDAQLDGNVTEYFNRFSVLPSAQLETNAQTFLQLTAPLDAISSVSAVSTSVTTPG